MGCVEGKEAGALGKERARSGLITDGGGDGDDDSFHAYSLPGSMAGDSYELS